MVIAFIGVFTLVATASYSFFTTVVRGKEYVITTGTLRVAFGEPNGAINLTDMYPSTNTQGLTNPGYSFNIQNTGTLTARYQLRLELDDTVKNPVPLEYVKIAYKKNNEAFSEPVLVSDLNSNLVFLSNQVLDATNTDNYELKIWIDLDAPIETANKVFKAKIAVDAIQNTDVGYDVNTAPIITLNQDSNGNYDVNLTVGDSYTELGVESVKDDSSLASFSLKSRTSC